MPDDSFEIRFTLDDQAAGAGDRQALVDFVREEIRNILAVAELTHQGQPVRIDGFRLARDPETIEQVEADA
jgi:hypothetical protein